MKKSEFEKNLFKKIKEQKIKPIPRWVFTFKKAFSWGIFFVSLLIGALSLGVVILFLLNIDWNIHGGIGSNLALFVLNSVPYFWTVFLIIFIPLSYFNFRHVPGAYRKGALKIFLLVLSLFLILGVFFLATGVSENLESRLYEHSPFYKEHAESRVKERWMKPHHGLLLGTILLKKQDGREMIIEDIKGNPWIVDLQKAVWAEGLSDESQESVKILGKMLSKGRFEAREIKPLGPKGQAWWDLF